VAYSYIYIDLDWVMVKSKKNGSLVERADFVDEYVEDDEADY